MGIVKIIPIQHAIIPIIANKIPTIANPNKIRICFDTTVTLA